MKLKLRKDGIKVSLETPIGKLDFNLSSNKNKTDIEKEILVMEKKPSILITITEDAEIIDNIAKQTQAVLLKENNIKISSSSAIPTIIYQFLKATVEEINKNKDKGDVNINLFHILDMGVRYEGDEDGENEGNFTPYVAPGQQFKLDVKDNDVTEE